MTKSVVNAEPPQELASKLIAYYKQRKFQEVLKEGEIIQRQYPDSVLIPQLLGVANAGLGRFEQAAVNFSRVTQINPDSAEAHANLGNALRGQGKLDEAIVSFRNALKIKSDHTDTLINLGTTLHESGNIDEAVTYYQKALKFKPDCANTHGNLGVALQKLGNLDGAVASYRNALAIEPNNAEVYFKLGNVLRETGKLDDAVVCYNKAIEIKLDFFNAHNNLGRTLRIQGKPGDAAISFRNALAINPGYAEAHNNLGNALLDLGELDEAIQSFTSAIAIKQDFPEAYNNLSIAYQEAGRMDEAIESYRQALIIKPGFAEAHRQLAAIKKFHEYDADIQSMEKAYIRPDYAEEQRMHLAFGLGKAFEDLRQYDKAFNYYLTGNSIKRNSFNYSIEPIAKTIENLKVLFTAELFDRQNIAGSSDRTPIFVLGMPRSGTTLVEQILASHPDVYGAGELYHLEQVVNSRFAHISNSDFNKILDQSGASDFASAGEDYVRLIRGRIGDAKFVTDKMPYNFQLIGMIRLMLPNAKVIHCCRSARDTCLSIFKNYFTEDGIYYAYDLSELGQYHNLYRDLMAHWHRVLPDFVYDIHYEDLVADQEAQSRALLKHCGLEWDSACLEFYNTNRPVNTASAAQVRNPMYKDSVQLWKRYEDRLTPLFDALTDQNSTT